METAAIIAALNGALSLSTTLLPLIQQLQQQGQITAQQQAALLAQYNSLKTQADGQFSGPEWKLSTAS